MIFVDTSFWYALRVARDRNHQLAEALLRRHAREPLVTTNLVLGEVWTLLNRRAGHAAAVATMDAVTKRSGLRVGRIEPRHEQAAWDWLRRHDEREYSFVDATSYAYMRERHLVQAFAFDGDFSGGGFSELRP